MTENNKRKRTSDHNKKESSRKRRRTNRRRTKLRNRNGNLRRKPRWFKGPTSTTAALGAKKSKLEKLPSNCLQRILSFVSYEKVSQMRRVCKTVNEIGKKLLNQKQKGLDERLRREMKRAEKRSLRPINLRASYDTLRMLSGLREAINNCTITYLPYVDYFVAGKLLDDADSLLKDFNGWTTVPYLVEHVYAQKPHPLLGPFAEHSTSAFFHFHTKILRKFIYQDLTNFPLSRLNYLELNVLREQNERKKSKINLLKYLRQKIDCRKKMGGVFLKSIVELNQNVLSLIERVKKADGINRCKGNNELLDKALLTNCLSSSSSAWREKTKATRVCVDKKARLALLPSSCLRNIVSHFNCEKIAQMRRLCKSFNEACKNQLNYEFGKVKRNVQFQIKLKEQSDALNAQKVHALKTDMLKDVSGLLQLCEDNYKWHLGANYHFAAGKVVDEVKRLVYGIRWDIMYLFSDFNRSYEYRPHFSLFHLMDVVYQAIAHFKFHVAPNHLPFTQKQTYVPDYIISGDDMHLDQENNVEQVEKLAEEAEGMIQILNDRNRKFLRIISALKKKVFILNKEICEKKNVTFF